MPAALRDPATLRRIGREVVCGVLGWFLGVAALVLARGMGGARGDQIGFVGAGLVLAGFGWTARTLLIARTLAGARWEQPRVEVFPMLGANERGQIVHVGAATEQPNLYARSLLNLRRSFPIHRCQRPLVAGSTQSRIVLASRRDGPFFLFHRPNGWVESRWAREIASRLLASDPRRLEDVRLDASSLRKVELKTVARGYDRDAVETFIERCASLMEAHVNGIREDSALVAMGAETQEVTFRLARKGVDPDQVDDLLETAHRWFAAAARDASDPESP